MKALLSVLFMVVLSNGFAQILNKDIKKNYATRFYFESQRMNMYRSLVSNDAFLPTPLGERASEIPLPVWSQQLGLGLGLSQHFYLDAGVSWLQNGESYAFKATDSDSSFAYQTKYRYLALPLQLKATFGKQLQFYTGAGLLPALYQGYRQDLQWTNALGAKYDDQVKINNTMNSFTIAWIASVGLDFQLDNKFNLRLGLIYRSQLNNSYSPYEAYIHKSYGWGLNFGISKKL
ncbi:MAG: hypothetical protein FJ349_01955 [Sphingomonadales bacterium]|nr:hypothetical protein [Sphingomonadales bacterium]